MTSQFPPENTCVDGDYYYWRVLGKIGNAFIEQRYKGWHWKCKGRGCNDH